jgi:hypothetical protein
MDLEAAERVPPGNVRNTWLAREADRVNEFAGGEARATRRMNNPNAIHLENPLDTRTKLYPTPQTLAMVNVFIDIILEIPGEISGREVTVIQFNIWDNQRPIRESRKMDGRLCRE